MPTGDDDDDDDDDNGFDDDHDGCDIFQLWLTPLPLSQKFWIQNGRSNYFWLTKLDKLRLHPPL